MYICFLYVYIYIYIRLSLSLSLSIYIYICNTQHMYTARNLIPKVCDNRLFNRTDGWTRWMDVCRHIDRWRLDGYMGRWMEQMNR